MKKLEYIIYLFIFLFVSCELDNYDQPSAGLYGSFIDAETGELVQQEIGSGTQVELREHGYNPVSAQYIPPKVDGTYQNKLLFASTYEVYPKGNFIPIDTLTVTLNGQTKLDFEVTPYIRLKDVMITKVGTKIVATFKIQQTVSGLPVQKIGLYAHSYPYVAQGFALEKKEQTINAETNTDRTWTLELQLPLPQLDEGKKYFFRVGALMGVPEAKFNYAPAVRIEI